MEFYPAGLREHRFQIDLPESRAEPHEAVQEAKKTMMPIARKCYIVLRATTFLRKDSL